MLKFKLTPFISLHISKLMALDCLWIWSHCSPRNLSLPLSFSPCKISWQTMGFERLRYSVPTLRNGSGRVGFAEHSEAIWNIGTLFGVAYEWAGEERGYQIGPKRWNSFEAWDMLGLLFERRQLEGEKEVALALSEKLKWIGRFENWSYQKSVKVRYRSSRNWEGFAM